MSKKTMIFYNSELQNKTDEEIAILAREGEESALEYLLVKYKDLVNGKVNKYFMIGAEKEDIIQEGMIG